MVSGMGHSRIGDGIPRLMCLQGFRHGQRAYSAVLLGCKPTPRAGADLLTVF